MVRKIIGKSHPSYILSGINGEDIFYIYNNWSKDHKHYLGHEIYDIYGCFRKMCVVHISEDRHKSYIEFNNGTICPVRNYCKEITEDRDISEAVMVCME